MYFTSRKIGLYGLFDQKPNRLAWFAVLIWFDHVWSPYCGKNGHSIFANRPWKSKDRRKKTRRQREAKAERGEVEILLFWAWVLVGFGCYENSKPFQTLNLQDWWYDDLRSAQKSDSSNEKPCDLTVPKWFGQAWLFSHSFKWEMLLSTWCFCKWAPICTQCIPNISYCDHLMFYCITFFANNFIQMYTSKTDLSSMLQFHNHICSGTIIIQPQTFATFIH